MSDLSPLQKMQNALVLQDVFVKRAQAHLEEDFDPKHSDVKLGVQIKFAPTENVSHFELVNPDDPEKNVTSLRFEVDTGVRFVSVSTATASSEPKVCAEVTAIFAIDYIVRKDSIVDDEGIQAFSDNVVYHVWPYWREFIHSTCNRLRLPVAMLPMFKPKKKSPAPTADVSGNASEKQNTQV